MNEEVIYLDTDNLEKISNLLEMYIMEEIKLKEKLDNIYKEIKEIYNSENSEYLDKLETLLIINMFTIKKNHENNILAINKRINHVLDIERKINQRDDEMNNYKIE